MQRLVRDGIALAFEEAGEGFPRMVFVHGWCCDRSSFAPQFAHFQKTHRVVKVDLRGHGAGDTPEQEYTVAAFADDVAWLCDRLELSQPVVVGHSLGGLIALELAALRPDLPAALALPDAPVFARPQVIE